MNPDVRALSYRELLELTYRRMEEIGRDHEEQTSRRP